MLSRLRARLAVVVASLLVVMGALVATPQLAFAAATHNEAGEWFYNNVLDEGQKLAYDQVLEQVQADPTILMDGDDPSKVTISIPVDKVGSGPTWLPAIINAFTRDHPEYFWINAGQLAWTRTADGDANNPRTYELSAKVDGFIYTGIDEAKLPQMWEVFNAKVDEIVASAPEDTIAALAYFDNWLSLNNQYNPNGLGALNISRCAYGAIMSNNSATDGPVCYGYATALKVLLDKAGIGNAYIEGWAYNDKNMPNGEQHAWNAVKYEGGWYAIDPTWDDPIGYSTRGSTGKYFMVGTYTVTESDQALVSAGLTQFSKNHDMRAVSGLNYNALSLSDSELPAVQLVSPDGTVTLHPTLQDAISTIRDRSGYTVRLVRPISIAKDCYIPDGTTIDLNSQGGANGNSNYALFCAGSSSLQIADGSTVTIINTGAWGSRQVASGSGVAIVNNGELLFGPFAGVKGASGGPGVSGNSPKGTQGGYLAADPTTGSIANAAQVVRPQDQTTAYAATAGDTAGTLLAFVKDASKVSTPGFSAIFVPGGTPTPGTNPVPNEWVLATGPDGTCPSDTDKPVNGDYTFILRPEGTTATDYYGYTVTLTVSVTVPKTVDEFRAEHKQQLADAFTTYVEDNYLADDWADIQAAYQSAASAIDTATEESAMKAAIDDFKTAADVVPTVAERLEAEQQKLKTELDAEFATYKESDYTAENWSELKGAYETGLSDIAAATTIADAQTAQQKALASMAAIEPKPVDPGTDPEPPVTQVTVTFQSRVPDEDPTTVTVDKGSTIARPTDPVLTGWRFTGWFSDTTYTKEWNFDDPVTSDLVLYAGWEKTAPEPVQEPDEPKKPQSDSSQNTNDDTLAKTSDSSIILVPMGLAAAGIAAIAASRKR